MKILIADDRRAMRMVIKAMLREAGIRGAEIIEAADGAEALQKAADEDPDLIISDWNMPNMTGLEFLQALRAAGNDVTFGFATTEVSPEMRAVAADSGSSFLIAKPFAAADFARAMAAYID